jgi:hypothetical protein
MLFVGDLTRVPEPLLAGWAGSRDPTSRHVGTAKRLAKDDLPRMVRSS